MKNVKTHSLAISELHEEQCTIVCCVCFELRLLGKGEESQVVIQGKDLLKEMLMKD